LYEQKKGINHVFIPRSGIDKPEQYISALIHDFFKTRIWMKFFDKFFYLTFNLLRRRDMLFPEYRPRRLRKNESFRALIRETHLSPSQLIYPIFVMPGKNKREEISSMPGVFRLSVDQLAKEGKECLKLGVNSVILFGLPEKKAPMGSGAHFKDGIIQRAIRELKKSVPGLLVFTDVCLCEYTSHGHCGIIIDKQVDNDTTLEVLAETAFSHASCRS